MSFSDSPHTRTQRSRAHMRARSRPETEKTQETYYPIDIASLFGVGFG